MGWTGGTRCGYVSGIHPVPESNINLRLSPCLGPVLDLDLVLVLVLALVLALALVLVLTLVLALALTSDSDLTDLGIGLNPTKE